MGTTAQKLEYLGTTKSQLKDMINYGLDDNNKITNSTTFRNYVSSIFNAFLEVLRTPDTLFTNLPKKSGSGSVISLNDTANAPMRITLGASELSQDATPTPSSPQDIHTISGSNKVVVNGSQLFDYNDFKTKMATLTTTGTGNTFTISGTGKFEYTFNQDEQCTLSGTWSTTYLNGDAVVIYEDNTTGVILADYSGTSKTGTINLTTNSSKKIKTIRFWFYNSSNVTLTNFMINKGNQATTYEPYVSQEAEIDLKSSNNLSPVIENSIVVNAGTVAEYRTDGSYSVVSTGQNSSPVSSRKDLLNSYTIKSGDYLHIMNDTIPTSGTVQIVGFDSSNTQIFAVSINSIKKIQDLSSYAGKSISKIQFYITANCVCNINLTPMILNTNTTTNFIKYYNYGEYCKIGNYEDKFIRTSGKNLIPLTNQDFTINNVSFKVQNGSIVLNGTANANITGFIMHTDNYFPITLDAGTYYFKRNLTNRSVGLIKANETVVVSLSGTSTSTSTTFTLTEKTTLYLFFYIASGTAINNEAWNILVSKEDIDYEPYGSNKWYIKKNIGKVDSYNGETITTTYMSTTGGLDIGATIYYGLSTPTYTQITGTLATQLEYVYQKMLSYSGTTNISQINNDLSFNMSVQAIEV